MVKDLFSYFPKSSCYKHQSEAVEEIFTALYGKRFVLFEGACGTGKTLSALVPALSVGERLGKVVVIATNVHQQMEQFIEEAREIQRKKHINVVVLTGKMLMCPHPDMDYDRCKLLRENTFELVDAERESKVIEAQLRSLKKKYEETGDHELFELRNAIARDADSERDQIRDLKKVSCNELYELLKSEPHGFREWLFSDVRRPEEVADWAYQRGLC